MAIFNTVYGGEWKWKPDASRTLLYYEFENNLNDSSGNGNNITGSSGITYEEVGGQYVVKNTSGDAYLKCNPAVINGVGTGDFTISLWLYPVSPASGKMPMVFGIWYENSGGEYPGPNIFFNPLSVYSSGDNIVWRTKGNGGDHYGAKAASSLYNGWHHILMTRNSGTVTCYIDKVVDASWTSDSVNITNCDYSFLIFSTNGSTQRWGNSGAKGDKLILEKVGWSADKVSNYYDSTKSIYGL